MYTYHIFNLRIRLAFEAIFRKSATLQDVDPDPEIGAGAGIRRDSQEVPPHTPMLAPSPATSKKVQLVRFTTIPFLIRNLVEWK